MKQLLFTLLCILAGSAFFRPAAAAPAKLSGVIEGFYGSPWTEEERLDMISFCKNEGLAAYVYAPKDDPYHRERWREPYPKEALANLQTLVQAAQRKDIRFLFAVSPGLDLHLSGKEAAGDEVAMLEKLESLYALGVRDFAIFFDDIEEKDGAGQAAFLNHISRELQHRHRDIAPLLTVPTEYDRGAMTDDEGNATPYTTAFSETLDPGILVLYTGEGVAKGNLTEDQYQAACKLYHRPLGLWWNYPVNDYQEQKLALGPVDTLPLASVPVILYNPMKYEHLSKIALATGATLAKDPAHYDPDAAWKTAIQKQYGPLAPAVETFADHSTHLGNHWADIGRPDAPAMQKKTNDLLAAYDQGAPVPVQCERIHALDKDLQQIQQAAEALEQHLDAETLSECRLQIEQLRRLAAADRTALDLLRQKCAGQDIDTTELIAAREEICAHEQEARISDGAARNLLDELLARL